MRVKFILGSFFLSLLIIITNLGNFSLWAAGAEGESEIQFSQGMLAYEKGDSKQASLFFQKSLELNPQYGAAAYFLGLISYDQKKYAVAIPFFNKAISLDATSAEPHFYLALSLYQMDQKDKALPEFKEAEALSKQGPIFDLSRSYRRSLEKGTVVEEKQEGAASSAPTAAKKWFLYGNVGALYDSNAVLAPSGLGLSFIPTNKDDFQFGLRLGGGYSIIQKQAFQLVSETNYNQTFYTDLTHLDYGTAHVEIRPQWEFGEQGRFYVTIPMAYEFSHLDFKKYLQSTPETFNIGLNLGEHWSFQFQNRFRYDSFFQSLTVASQAQDRDAFNEQPELGVYFFFDHKKRFFKVSYNYEGNYADGNDWDYSAHSVGGAFSSPLFYGLNVYTYAQYTFDKDFDHVDSVLAVKRADKTQVYGVNVSRDIGPHMIVSAQYSFQKNHSNIPLFSYERHLTGVNFGVRY